MDKKKEIDMLKCSDNKQAYNVLKKLLAISEKSPELYPFFNEFVDMMNNQENSFIRTRGLRLIAYHSKWDTENKVNSIIDDWLEHIEDAKPITARQCIKDTVMIAKYKPELIDTILNSLENFHKIYDDSMQSLIYKDIKQAIRQIRQYTW
ncbi:hypothetical protein [Candidatus Stoquefichus massiliensis]|uniref:hypothetical protein n=1 Tax=Candidatus Stoquefichus massiliensis TaxID=1470350 RepID=UPI000484310C|nr:hypothetical protein [Candidatus Stoquefichus massiliensis]